MNGSCTSRKRFYELGRPLGMKNKEIDDILNHIHPMNEQPSFSAGPIYPGGWYGTVSIYEF